MDKKSQIRLQELKIPAPFKTHVLKVKKILIFSFILIGILSLYFVIAQIVVQNEQLISSKLINATAETNFTHLSINNNINGDINVISAKHLDSNKDFISDIFAEIEHKNNIWSEIIPNNEFVKVIYEENLINGNVIDVYVKGEGWFEIYDSELNLVGTSKIFNSTEGWDYIVMSNLFHPTDTFYFKIKGSLQFDYIHDAASLSEVSLLNPTQDITYINTGGKFAMNCSFSCSGTGTRPVNLSFDFNTTAAAWARINTALALENWSKPSFIKTNCTNGKTVDWNINVNITTAGTYYIKCQAISNEPANSNSTILKVVATDNTCNYGGTGNWNVNCLDRCVISSNVAGGGIGNNFTATGSGRFVMTANISGFKNYKFGGGCNATCKSGGCIRI